MAKIPEVFSRPQKSKAQVFVVVDPQSRVKSIELLDNLPGNKSVQFFTANKIRRPIPIPTPLPGPNSIRLSDIPRDAQLRFQFEKAAAERLQRKAQNGFLILAPLYRTHDLAERLQNLKFEADLLQGPNKVPQYIFHEMVSRTPYAEEDIDPQAFLDPPANPLGGRRNIFQRLGFSFRDDRVPDPICPSFSTNRRRPPAAPEESEEKIDKIHETAWRYFFRRLSMEVHPLDNISRNSDIYRNAWLAHSREPAHVFKYPREQVRRRNQRINFILQQRNAERRSAHRKGVQRARERRLMMAVFRTEYLQFRMRRTKVLKATGLFKDMRRLGWTAHKEWMLWRRRHKENHRIPPPHRQGRIARLTIPIDRVQLDAERTMFVRKVKLQVEKCSGNKLHS